MSLMARTGTVQIRRCSNVCLSQAVFARGYSERKYDDNADESEVLVGQDKHNTFTGPSSFKGMVVNSPLRVPPIRRKYRVPYDEKKGWKLSDVPTGRPSDGVGTDDDTCNMIRDAAVGALKKHQRRLFSSPYSVLIILQGMDAGGKDSTIRMCLSGIDPAGCQIYGFRQPSAQEMQHDWLHRTRKLFPERGRIGVFNRSYYEETLVVRVHPQYLKSYGLQGLYADAPFSDPVSPHKLWDDRFESIRDMELHAARNNTIILKFMLHISKPVQAERLLSRVRTPGKQWKFSAADLNERQHWEKYQQAYEDVIKRTSRPWAPWYVIPADDKPFAQMMIAGIVEEAVAMLKLTKPSVSERDKERLVTADTILSEELRAAEKMGILKDAHGKAWDKLKKKEKITAEAMGYSEENWDEELQRQSYEHSALFAELVEHKIREVPWHSMPHFKQLAALQLGYVPETWNNPDFELPLRSKSFDQLTAEEIVAVHNLGYTERSWTFKG